MIIKRGKFLSDDEHKIFIEMLGRKKSITSIELIPQLKRKKDFSHLFSVSGSVLQSHYDRKVFNNILKSFRQPHNGSDIPLFNYNPATKKYEIIKEYESYLDGKAKKFLKSAIGCLSHRPTLKEELINILNML